jgi:methylated-DNA-[protein]-cysteine S-methyltransferase
MVTISWEGNIVYQVHFARSAQAGPVPMQFTKFLAGRTNSFLPLISAVIAESSTAASRQMAVSNPAGLQHFPLGDCCSSIYTRIYAAVSQIPYGETRTYREIALSASTHPRVVGNAMAKNPTALIVPCHRVIASNGTLGGFTPDLQIKKDLLRMEAAKRRTFGKS